MICIGGDLWHGGVGRYGGDFTELWRLVVGGGGGGGERGGRGGRRQDERCAASVLTGAWQPRAARLDVVRFKVALLQRNHRAYQGRAAHDGHLHFHTAPGLCNYISWLKCRFTSTETLGLLGTGSPGRPPRLSHSP